MPQPKSRYSFSVCFCLLILALFTGCSSLLDKFEPKDLLTVSFERSLDYNSPRLPPFSSRFEMKVFSSSPAVASDHGTHLYTRQLTCLEGKAIGPKGEAVPVPDQEGDHHHKINICFTINDPMKYTTTFVPPIYAGVFPFAKQIPAKLDEKEPSYLNEVSGLGLTLTEHYANSLSPRERLVTSRRDTHQGSIEITVSEQNRLVGKINVQDGNLSITGSFDCRYHLRRIRGEKL